MEKPNSKDKLLECALTVFSQKGYDGAGINEIVEAAGVTKPTLYYFFGSKEGLFEAVLEKYYRRFNTVLAQAAVYTPNASAYEKDVLPVLLRIAEAYFAFAMENTRFYMMLLSLSFAPPTAPPAGMTEPYHITQYQTVTRCFEHIAGTHANLKGKEQQIACHFIALLNANIGLWHHGRIRLDGQKAAEITRQFMHGIFS